MGIDNNVTLGRLAEDLCKFHHRERLRRDHIPQDISRSDARKLVNISHKDQPRPHIYGL